MPEQPYEGSVWTDGMNERDQFRLLVHQHTKATRWLRNALNAGQGVVSTRIVLNLLTEWPEEFAPTPSAQTEAPDAWPLLPPPAYRCNCGEEFPHPGARIVHMVTCPVMLATRPPDDPAPSVEET